MDGAHHPWLGGVGKKEHPLAVPGTPGVARPVGPECRKGRGCFSERRADHIPDQFFVCAGPKNRGNTRNGHNMTVQARDGGE